MAEIEFAGIKFKGGRMVAVAMGLSTLVGGLYGGFEVYKDYMDCLLYTSPSPRDRQKSRMPSSA